MMGKDALEVVSNVNEHPLVSIVTPVYNGEHYIAECIESVLSQTYRNFEYLIANNASTDRSLDIAKAYERKDGRIRVFNNEAHLGQVDNINQLLRKISPRSRYCKAIFADDWLYPECVERMVGLGELYPSVGIVSSYYIWGAAVMNVGLPPTQSVFKGPDICMKTLLTGEFYFGTPSVILWRSDLIRSRYHFYDRNSLHEDTEACYEFLGTWDFGFVPQVLAFVRRGNASITAISADFNPDSLDSFIILKKYGLRYLREDVYKRRLSRVKQSYMKFLAKSVLKREGKSFWNYHRKGLKTIDVRLNKGRLARYSVLVGLELLLNPKSTIQGVFARIRQRKGSPPDVSRSRDIVVRHG